MQNVTLYTDGAARGNPDGPGGYGAVLQFVDSQGNLHEREFSAGYIRTTNNRMELMAVIAGLEALTKPCRVEIVSDSKYVTDAFNKKWIDGWLKKNWKGASGPVKNVDLWKRLLAAAQPHELHFTWVKGHAGHPENERCDHLATTAADTNAVLTDPGVHGGRRRLFNATIGHNRKSSEWRRIYGKSGCIYQFIYIVSACVCCICSCDYSCSEGRYYRAP